MSPERPWLLVSAAAALVLIAGGFWWARATPVPLSTATVADDNSGISILLGLAGSAMREHRLVAPVGSNAYEFYQSVLQLDPHNALALKAQDEAFGAACDDLESTISRGDLDEAARELRLLRDYDANNYKLALFASYLDAQRVLLSKQHALESARIRARSAGLNSATN
jgi:protein TonB